MKEKILKLLAVGACVLLYATITVAQTASPNVAAAKIPVADFFKTPKLFGPKPSPDGLFVAVGVASASGRVNLVVIDLNNLAASKVVASFGDADIGLFQWVNSDRLVFNVRDLKSGTARYAPGLWGVDKNGGEFKALINPDYNVVVNSSAIVDQRLSSRWSLHSTLADGSSDVIVQSPTFDNTWAVIDVKLARLNTKTGRTKSLSADAPPQTVDWVLDLEGQPAMTTSSHEGRFKAFIRVGQAWKLWQDVDQYSGNFKTPFWMGPNREMLVLSGNRKGTNAVFEVDSTSLKLSDEPLITLAGYDFNGTVVYDSVAKKVVGFQYETDAPGTVWLDKEMQQLQKEIDALLPTTVNTIDCQRCLGAPAVVVSAISDRAPASYFVYRKEQKKLEPLGSSRPWINPAQMGVRDMYRFDARDKRSIPVLVTQPLGKPNPSRPAVVLVHGGPYVRGAHWEWERDAQFLASRGYVVIEPEFRGSDGYGFDHFRAGWKQWGLAMQDDVADALQWAVKQGWVDPARVCIAGASYGGYATLMGLIKHPDIYKCGINWVGVSDINLMYDITWSDTDEAWKRYGMPVLVGDQVKDAQQLKDTSPLEQASKLKRPLLMAYGAEDQRVPLKHGTAFRNAVLKTNKDVEWVVYPNEGHGWRELDTNIDFWTRVENFLERNIGH